MVINECPWIHTCWREGMKTGMDQGRSWSMMQAQWQSMLTPWEFRARMDFQSLPERWGGPGWPGFYSSVSIPGCPGKMSDLGKDGNDYLWLIQSPEEVTVIPAVGVTNPSLKEDLGYISQHLPHQPNILTNNQRAQSCYLPLIGCCTTTWNLHADTSHCLSAGR